MFKSTTEIVTINFVSDNTVSNKEFSLRYRELTKQNKGSYMYTVKMLTLFYTYIQLCMIATTYLSLLLRSYICFAYIRIQ